MVKVAVTLEVAILPLRLKAATASIFNYMHRAAACRLGKREAAYVYSVDNIGGWSHHSAVSAAYEAGRLYIITIIQK